MPVAERLTIIQRQRVEEAIRQFAKEYPCQTINLPLIAWKARVSIDQASSVHADMREEGEAIPRGSLTGRGRTPATVVRLRQVHILHEQGLPRGQIAQRLHMEPTQVTGYQTTLRRDRLIGYPPKCEGRRPRASRR
jgi:hypothetical protein